METFLLNQKGLSDQRGFAIKSLDIENQPLGVSGQSRKVLAIKNAFGESKGFPVKSGQQ